MEERVFKYRKIKLDYCPIDKILIDVLIKPLGVRVFLIIELE